VSAAPPVPGPGSPTARLLDDFAARRSAALARVISIVENHRSGFDALLAALHERTGRARRIGITGPPGAGKSTLTTHLIQSYRNLGLTVGVIAVDPTSPFTGGALLGDRIRMEAVALDPGVYIRSLATRGALGGLSAATREASDVLDAFGFDRVIVETVGVGQSELDVARTVDTCVVVLVPESGDAIQTLKAGLMEIADVFVINKADRPGADRLRTEIQLMLKLRARAAAAPSVQSGVAPGGAKMPSGRAHALDAKDRGPRSGDDGAGHWIPPVLTTIATDGTGIADVVTALDQHYEYLSSTGLLSDRRRARLRERVKDVVHQKVGSRLWSDPSTVAWLDAQLPALESGRTTPYDVADALLVRSAALVTGRLHDVNP
jgi:LAO/AO transport system kinase